jgi:hypothetical protein
LTAALSGLAAHGIAGRQDLPIPFWAAVLGAAVALVATFAILAFAWPTPRLNGSQSGTEVPTWLSRLLDSAWWRWGWRVFGLLIAAYVGVAALFGPDDALNPTAGFLYVIFWVGILAVGSALLGPIWPALNPIRTLAIALSRVRGSATPRTLPESWGIRPAVLTLGAFIWLELVAPDRGTLGVINAFVALYVLVMLIGVFGFGLRWLDAADGFENYSRLVGTMSVLGRRGEVRVWRGPLRGLDALRPVSGLVAFLVLLIGSTLYDGLSNSPQWIRIAQSGTLPQPVIGTLGLVLATAAIGVIYAVAARASGRIGGGDPTAAPMQFAHSLIPIALGYVIAHYYSLLVIAGQQTVQRLSDPLGNGSDLLGVADRGVDLTWAQPTTVATVQVLAVVGGHIAAALLAHDRAVRVLPSRPVAGQIPLLTAMVIFTVTALLLLFAA